MALDQEAPPQDMVPRRGSRKGKERAIVGAQRSEDGQQGHGYTYQEPEYLTHLAKIAARDMARRKAARTSKLYAPAAAVPAGHSGDGGMGATAATALAPVTSTLVSGLSRASTLLRNRTRRGHSSRGSNGGGGGGSDADHLASSSPHSKRPASMFGFWRIPSIDSSMAEEREEERRHGGWVGEEGNEHKMVK
ncbi:hypothetical protein QFC19_002477 [Naganishia cerealis]|uniref:Uncharacterized protein n=1 Tax=Naganishia cerealis TaxID=610337 RepID=A0ACC2WA88_9TREE|nr:hypothetical protein QFC19_002477 [Naganishia cerealis]